MCIVNLCVMYITVYSISNRLSVYMIGALFIINNYVVYIISQLNIKTNKKQKKNIKKLIKKKRYTNIDCLVIICNRI